MITTSLEGNPAAEERTRLMAAVQNSGYSTSGMPAPPSLQAGEEEPGTLELTLLHVLEMLLEYTTNYITLAPLFGLSQPLHVLKTRAHYRYLRQQYLMPSRIQEVDDAGHALQASPPVLAPVRWRRIREEEGAAALWKGWNARLVHQALWRGGSLTLLQYALIFPANSRLGITVKSVLAFGLVTYAAHPLAVAQTRMQAACSGYSHASIYNGLMQTLKDSAGYAGLKEALLLAGLSVPVKFGFFSLPLSLAWMLALYPLDRRATVRQLEGVIQSEGGQRANDPDAGKSWWARNYGDGCFSFYASQVGMELTVSALCSALLDAAIQVLEDQD